MLHEDNCKPVREAFEFLDLVRLILVILRYIVFRVFCFREFKLRYSSYAQICFRNQMTAPQQRCGDVI